MYYKSAYSHVVVPSNTNTANTKLNFSSSEARMVNSDTTN